MTATARRLETLGERVASCEACPRLVAWRQEVAANPRASFRGQDYWARGVPGFGDPAARIVIVGLAPAAHGANRTGRMFTGDRSGDFLYAALHRIGVASQPTSTEITDGLTLTGCWITSVVKCAPPANKPTPAERDSCTSFLVEEMEILERARVIVALGAFALDGVRRALTVRPRLAFGHGVVHKIADTPVGDLSIVCSYHPSQQNTFTGRLTEPMLDAVLTEAVSLAGGG